MENLREIIYDAIINEAVAEGITDLSIIDKDFILAAIKNEIARREHVISVRPYECPPTYFDIYNEFRINNPADAMRVVDWRPARPPYYDECIPMTILLYYDKNDTRKTGLYAFKGEK